VVAGAGNDRVYAGDEDATADMIDCGDGYDRAVVGPEDTTVDCEDVVVVEPAVVDPVDPVEPDPAA
jgi:hypothetical protein